MAIVTEAQVIKVLQQLNPWWRNPAEIKPRSKPRKRVAYYEAIKTVEHKTIRRFAVLSGARRVGKTTILYQMIDKIIADGINPRNILYVSFDNPIIKLINADELISIYETLHPITGERYVFFDEIQYTNDWELWMKVIYDIRSDVRLAATGSASPVLEKGASDSGTGRWRVLKVPTMSFYEYCELLSVPDLPEIPAGLRITGLSSLSEGELADLMNRFSPMRQHFNRYMTIGGFPELALSGEDVYARRILREDVVDKVIKRDVLSLFNVRNPLSMEKLFIYLCMNSSGIFNKQTAASALENISVSTIEDYIRFLEMSNLIYCSAPIKVGGKASLKGKPKIYIADAAIRNAVLMIEDVLSDEAEMGIMAETLVYKHIVAFFQNNASAHIGYYRNAKDNQKEVDIVIELPKEKILCEVKYRNDSAVPETDAIVALSNEEKTNVSHAFVLSKSLAHYGISRHETKVPIFRIPVLPFVYMLGKAEAEGRGGKI
ncbi:MAG: ATP-binding protein [Clostridiales Family XIII bacterium]|jgi:predicted AAA+ superfamily ATPase|nr:ATP-binding protein [Clostridiales Family XIII bacterium]